MKFIDLLNDLKQAPLNESNYYLDIRNRLKQLIKEFGPKMGGVGLEGYMEVIKEIKEAAMHYEHAELEGELGIYLPKKAK